MSGFPKACQGSFLPRPALPYYFLFLPFRGVVHDGQGYGWSISEMVGCNVFHLVFSSEKWITNISTLTLPLCSDVPTKVFITSLNDQRERSEKFILEDLDSKHLFVQPTIVEELEEQLKIFQDQNTYQPPRKEG